MPELEAGARMARQLKCEPVAATMGSPAIAVVAIDPYRRLMCLEHHFL